MIDDNINKQEAERGQPARGIATLSMLALIRSHSDALDLLKFFKFSNISDLAIVVPLKCLNLVVRPNLIFVFMYLRAVLQCHVRNSLCLVLVQFLLFNFCCSIIWVNLLLKAKQSDHSSSNFSVHSL